MTGSRESVEQLQQLAASMDREAEATVAQILRLQRISDRAERMAVAVEPVPVRRRSTRRDD